MAVFTVEHFLRQSGSAIAPGSFVYIRRTGPAEGGIFRVEIGPSGTPRRVDLLDGDSWRLIVGGLSVDASNRYLAFWLGGNQPRNFPTQVLRFALTGESGAHLCRVSPADSSRRRLLVPDYSPVTLTSTTLEGPFYHNPGAPVSHRGGPPTNYYWIAQWGTSASTGYIIQRIETTIVSTSCGGVAAPITGTPLYWEAWQIIGRNSFAPHSFDIWTLDISAGTRGTWSKQGDAYWVPHLENAWDFRAGSVRNAGPLLQSTTVRVHDLGEPIMSRNRSGRWDGCMGHTLMNTHQET